MEVILAAAERSGSFADFEYDANSAIGLAMFLKCFKEFYVPQIQARPRIPFSYRQLHDTPELRKAHEKCSIGWCILCLPEEYYDDHIWLLFCIVNIQKLSPEDAVIQLESYVIARHATATLRRQSDTYETVIGAQLRRAIQSAEFRYYDTPTTIHDSVIGI